MGKVGIESPDGKATEDNRAIIGLFYNLLFVVHYDYQEDKSFLFDWWAMCQLGRMKGSLNILC